MISKITKFVNFYSNDSRNVLSVPSELKNKIKTLKIANDNSFNLSSLIEVLNFANNIPFYFPEIFTLIFDDINAFFLLKNEEIELVLNSISHWQDWKIGIKFIERISFQTQAKPYVWMILADFTFKLGQLCYNLFKGSNYALTLLFFQKTLNFLSKGEDEKKIHVILSSTLWFIGKIEFERGYSIKSSDYQLSSIYYQKNLTPEEFGEYFQSTNEEMRNSFILSSFQAATEYFISGKVAAQSFHIEIAKNYFSSSYQFLNRVIKIISEKESDDSIISQLKTFLIQLHSIIDKEGFIPRHSCDFNLLSKQNIELKELIPYIRLHSGLLDDRDKKLFWLSVLDQGGIALFEYDFEEQKITSKNTLYSSFMHVVSKWGQVEFESGPVRELNFMGNSFVIEVQEPIEIIAVVSKPSPEFHLALRNFANGFNNEFKDYLLGTWDGNIKIFEEKSLLLIEKFISSLESN